MEYVKFRRNYFEIVLLSKTQVSGTSAIVYIWEKEKLDVSSSPKIAT